jgi:hypothetical protein
VLNVNILVFLFFFLTFFLVDDIISDPPKIKSDTALLFSHPLETVTPINDTRHSEFQACVSVKEVGISYDQNPNHRRTMEDEHIFIDRFGGKEDQFYVGVYDGHGGKLVAEQVRENLHKVKRFTNDKY